MKGNNTNNFDQLIRAKLEGHTVVPPPALRASFINNARQTKEWYRKPIYWSMAALFLVFSVSAYLLIDLSPSIALENNKTIENKPSDNLASKQSHTKEITSQRNDSSIESKEEENHSDIVNNLASSSNRPPQGQVIGTEGTNDYSKSKDRVNEVLESEEQASATLQEKSENAVAQEDLANQKMNSFEDFGLISSLNRRNQPLPLSYSSSLEYRKVKQANISRFKEEETPKGFTFPRNKYYVGVNYSPEWMFNTVGDDKKLVHNAGLEFHYTWNDFIIRTGVGISIASGTSEIAVDYREYLGHYTKLDSTSYVWNSTQEKVEAVYHVSDFKVFDTTLLYAKQIIEKEYTYLRIPLIFGYDFYKRSRILIGVRTGPILSVLLKTTEKGNYDPGNNKVISINNLSPDRVNTNWQFTGGLVFGYHLNKSLRLEAEPSIKYYFNSVYEKNATIRKPWSLETRVALVYGF